MTIHHVRVFEGGKIVIPAALRKKYGFEVGRTLVINDDDQKGLTLRTLDDAVAKAQAIMAKVAPVERQLSSEILAERRADASRG